MNTAERRVVEYMRRKLEVRRINFELDKKAGVFDSQLKEFPNLRPSDWLSLSEFHGSGIQYRTLRRMVATGLLEGRDGQGWGMEFRVPVREAAGV